MPVDDRRLPAGKMVASVATVGVAVGDDSTVDIVQHQVAGVFLVKGAEVLRGVKTGHKDQRRQFFLIVKDILRCFALGIGVGAFDDIKYSDLDEQMIERAKRFSDFSSSYRLKMVPKSDVSSMVSDILSLIFGEPVQGVLAMCRKILNSVALPAFEAAARHSNFARAAAELALTEGTVSW